MKQRRRKQSEEDGVRSRPSCWSLFFTLSISADDPLEHLRLAWELQQSPCLCLQLFGGASPEPPRSSGSTWISDENMEKLTPSASKEAQQTSLPAYRLHLHRQLISQLLQEVTNETSTLREGWKRRFPLEAPGATEGSHYVNAPKYQSVGCFQAEPVDSEWVEKWNLLGVISRNSRHGGQTCKSPPEWCSPVSPPADWFSAAVRREWINWRRRGDKSQQRPGANLLHHWAFVDRLQPRAKPSYWYCAYQHQFASADVCELGQPEQQSRRQAELEPKIWTALFVSHSGRMKKSRKRTLLDRFYQLYLRAC